MQPKDAKLDSEFMADQKKRLQELSGNLTKIMATEESEKD